MKNKRAQSEVITTVLIILLVLAAVFIVYTAVRNMVQGGTTQATEKQKCLEIGLNIVSVNKTSGNVTITRLSGGADGDVTDVTILVDGTSKTVLYPTDKSLTQMSTKIYTVGAITNAKKVEVGAVLGATKCDVIDSETSLVA
ncbi:MAG: hypothetical protein KKB21_02680 [Nanoarchaeota archaeon]|nr:hypothetical protein [Nanoarchaeota archaeon]MBU4086460.1 hypothetical protein [Nanoarchaeota archaeon]